jgi:hypothetical protein
MRSSLKILFLSFVWTGLILSLGIYSGWVTISVSAHWLMHPTAFVYRHLRLSIVLFGCLLLLYAWDIARGRYLLRHNETQSSKYFFCDDRLNNTISSFFVVGGLWTCIGMINALMEVGTAAGNLSARDLLDKLISGGLLLALSTTVFGGFCVLLLGNLKYVFLGEDWYSKKEELDLKDYTKAVAEAVRPHLEAWMAQYFRGLPERECLDRRIVKEKGRHEKAHTSAK